MGLPDCIQTFGKSLREQFGFRVHKLTINAAFSCPNRDGTKGIGGCTFCNNVSFNPHSRQTASVAEQIACGRKVIRKRTGARSYLAYFQAYTNTYSDVNTLRALYDQALAEPDVLGLCIGTRPDCVPDQVLRLLAEYMQNGVQIWLELGLQSSFDRTLEKINRGHTFADYVHAVQAARAFNLPVCTHLIVGLPGESGLHALLTLQRVLDLGVDGLKLHPLHVVKGTQLANQWRRGEYRALKLDEYVNIVADMLHTTPAHIIFHRLTGTASEQLLLAPAWCASKWRVLNAIEKEMNTRGISQGSYF